MRWFHNPYLFRVAAVLACYCFFSMADARQADAQTDQSNGSVVHNSDSVSLSQADSVREARVVAVDSSKSHRTAQLEIKYRLWRDQFPSPVVQHSYGSPTVVLDEIPRKQQREDWKFYLAFSLLILLALIRFGYAREFEELFSAFKNWGPSQQMFRELGTGVSFGTVLLNLFSLLVISLFVFLLLGQFGSLHIDPPWIVMLIAVAAVSFFLLARYLLLKAASLLLPFRKEITLYNFYEIQLNRVLGVLLFPLVLLLIFAPAPSSTYALYSAFAVSAGCILIRYLKGFNIGINYFGRHLFHFLLYICALEIAPVLIIIRLLQNLGPLRFSF